MDPIVLHQGAIGILDSRLHPLPANICELAAMLQANAGLADGLDNPPGSSRVPGPRQREHSACQPRGRAPVDTEPAGRRGPDPGLSWVLSCLARGDKNSPREKSPPGSITRHRLGDGSGAGALASRWQGVTKLIARGFSTQLGRPGVGATRIRENRIIIICLL